MFISVNKSFCLLVIGLLAFTLPSLAGPPYDTDDPEPVDFHHWEFYCSSLGSMGDNTWMGTAPHIEVNYGVIPNIQLHVIAPLSFYSPQQGKTNYGYGDTEFGTKLRFVNKDSSRFQIGIFPLIELPTGNAAKNLGNGKTQIYIPLWIQKTSGKWTTYGGGGYWINPGVGNKNYEFIGWQAQDQFVKNVSIGCELYYITASKVTGSPENAYQVGANSEFNFNIGCIVDLSDDHHLLFSVGRSIVGSVNLQWYIGYQLTI